MKILVTGHRGFIGSHLVPALVKAGHYVVGYDLQEGDDIRNKYQLELAFENERFDQVIHLAALAGVRRSERFPEEYISTNIIGTKNVVEACERFKVKQLINFSSSSVYGGVVAGSHDKLHERMATNPQSIYGMTKLMAEHIVNRCGAPTFTVRPFTVYGPDGRKDQVMMRWIEHINVKEAVPVYADSKDDANNMIRGFTHVRDLVDGVCAMVDFTVDPACEDGCGTSGIRDMHYTLNLGGDQAISLWQLLQIFGKVTPFKYRFIGRQPGDVGASIADTKQAFNVLGWEPKMHFAKEVTKIIKHSLRT